MDANTEQIQQSTTGRNSSGKRKVNSFDYEALQLAESFRAEESQFEISTKHTIEILEDVVPILGLRGVAPQLIKLLVSLTQNADFESGQKLIVFPSNKYSGEFGKNSRNNRINAGISVLF